LNSLPLVACCNFSSEVKPIFALDFAGIRPEQDSSAPDLGTLWITAEPIFAV
jgi:hypothetical protein